MRRSHILVVASALLAIAAPLTPAGATSRTSGTVSGHAFHDANRNGVRDAGEAPLTDQLVYAYEVGGSASAQARTDVNGYYVMPSLPSGSYLVTYSGLSWTPLQNDWVPTTTGTVRPEREVSVSSGTTTVDFGWRRIVRSSTAGSPMSRYTSPEGLQVESYNDAVSAREVYDTLARGHLGAEQPYVLVRFDLGSTSYCSLSWQRSAGTVGSFWAVCDNNWATFIDQGDWGLSHEYGHAWTSYRDAVLQQDGTFASYLRARGLEGDPRVGSSYLWNADELIAEDYRQLLGSPTASAVPQANRELPPAEDVPGLEEWFLGAFSQPRSSSDPSTTPSETALDVTAPTMSPTPVAKSGTAATSVSRPADVTLRILDRSGNVVRTLVQDLRTSGDVTARWDRKTSTGRRAASGQYTLEVTARDGGSSVVRSSLFSVS